MNFVHKNKTSNVKQKLTKNCYYSKTKKLNKKQFRKKDYPWKRYGKYYKWKLLRLREHPHKIARGFAVGVFSGCLPLMGLQFLISLLLAFIVRGNKFTALMGTWISNPFTYVPLFIFNFHVGKIILGFFISNQDLQFNWQSWREFAQMGTEITVTLLFGSVIVGIVFATIAYHFILRLLYHWKKNKL
ncbi:Protein of unknown function DUF2062 [Cyanobacterium aponinum PCC 10605]|uniref:DUF2062 domain-containing protein n=1 Tax=Cyanobacterium aponinum (strain PCC 10605) TaxID=755178 RepID=K9Z6G4_CYAAP|nr:Protein of unknown function DUF2062 [Cyanobacterium aponinum PCC 10605]